MRVKAKGKERPAGPFARMDLLYKTVCWLIEEVPPDASLDQIKGIERKIGINRLPSGVYFEEFRGDIVLCKAAIIKAVRLFINGG